MSSKDDNDEECLMHSKSDNIEIMISDKANNLNMEHITDADYHSKSL